MTNKQPTYLSYLLRLGFDVQFIGLMVGLGQVVWAAAALPAGMLSNRIGLGNGLMLGSAQLVSQFHVQVFCNAEKGNKK